MDLTTAAGTFAVKATTEAGKKVTEFREDRKRRETIKVDLPNGEQINLLCKVRIKKAALHSYLHILMRPPIPSEPFYRIQPSIMLYYCDMREFPNLYTRIKQWINVRSRPVILLPTSLSFELTAINEKEINLAVKRYHKTWKKATTITSLNFDFGPLEYAEIVNYKGFIGFFLWVLLGKTSSYNGEDTITANFEVSNWEQGIQL